MEEKPPPTEEIDQIQNIPQSLEVESACLSFLPWSNQHERKAKKMVDI